ncbi:GH39 family glycosyl hydrolase [Allorhizocola rhizosphaerae]|uniref:GH39 family glycosyl hydrolase n=1 Tax=Allorhizocola rhizosphaerae TaxID=1872709 RepID=UPI0013C30D19|nr:beta-xylosidase [Allorhizocola rhizosphaerae]
MPQPDSRSLPPPVLAAVDTVTVNFASELGAPVYRASGILYGMTEDGAGPADHFFTDIRFRFGRAGGAQLDNPGGWTADRYQRRWDSTLAQYRRAAGLGGTFIILPHDLWGADGTTSPRFPGDNGDWTDYDNFLDRLISDVRVSDMTPQWDLWNEPDLDSFWQRSQAQYLEMWRRTYARIRLAFPDAVIVGASTSRSPSAEDPWWNGYLHYVKANNVVPDIVSWHSLNDDIVSVDPTTARQAMDALLSGKGIDARPYQINEYGWPSQQNPANSGWYISRLERNDIDGLRANWASGSDLHNDMAAMLAREGGRHVALADWFLYRHYAAMSGTRVSVTPGNAADGYATKDDGVAHVLLGNRGVTGDVTVSLTGLTTTPVEQSGRVRAVLYRFPYNNKAAIRGPITVSDQVLPVSGGTASVTVPWTDPHDGYAVTLLPPDKRKSAAGGLWPNTPGTA